MDGVGDAVSFSGANGGSVASVFGGLNDTTGGRDFSGDIVQLRYTAVPEPASAVLVFMGAAALALGRRLQAVRRNPL